MDADRAVSPEAVIWTDGPRAELTLRVLELMGSAIQPIAVGGPRENGVSRLAQRLGAPVEDDPRRLMIHHPSAFVLLTSSRSLAPADIAPALGQGSTVLALEPLAADLQALRAIQPGGSCWPAPGAGGAGSAQLLAIPSFVESPGFLKAADPREALGDRRTVMVHAAGDPAGGSLFARLLDAWRAALWFCDVPEAVDAALVGVSDDPPEHLDALSGRLTAHGRTPGGAAVLLQVADQPGRDHVSVHVAGDAGVLSVDTHGYRLWHADGRELDSGAADPAPAGLADRLAMQWRRLLDRPGFASPQRPDRDTEALACCLSCLLSARTRQPENPRRILQINR